MHGSLNYNLSMRVYEGKQAINESKIGIAKTFFPKIRLMALVLLESVIMEGEVICLFPSKA
jgi:hypothetical protein